MSRYGEIRVKCVAELTEEPIKVRHYILLDPLKRVGGNNTMRYTYIVITRIELGALRCQIVLRKMSVQRAQFIFKVQKRIDFINRTDIFKISLNVAKIHV